jgi:hypothetical protein
MENCAVKTKLLAKTICLVAARCVGFPLRGLNKSLHAQDLARDRETKAGHDVFWPFVRNWVRFWDS